jgi:hypothetical protein
LWILGFLVDIFSTSTFMRENAWGGTGGLSPGIGLWLGLGIGVAVVGIFAALMTVRKQTLWLYAAEGLGLVLGVLLIVLTVQPWDAGTPENRRDSKYFHRYKPLMNMP